MAFFHPAIPRSGRALVRRSQSEGPGWRDNDNGILITAAVSIHQVVAGKFPDDPGCFIFPDFCKPGLIDVICVEK